jgi:hypothetical protein
MFATFLLKLEVQECGIRKLMNTFVLFFPVRKMGTSHGDERQQCQGEDIPQELIAVTQVVSYYTGNDVESCGLGRNNTRSETVLQRTRHIKVPRCTETRGTESLLSQVQHNRAEWNNSDIHVWQLVREHGIKVEDTLNRNILQYCNYLTTLKFNQVRSMFLARLLR